MLTWPKIIVNKRNSYSFMSHKLNDDLVKQVKQALTLNWPELLSKCESVNQKFLLFHDILLSTINDNIIEKEVKIRYKKIICEPWLTKGIIKANKNNYYYINTGL